MIRHTDFENSQEGLQALYRRIRQRDIVLGGNLKLKIYGSLHCNSGKKMLRENRVFFHSENEAIQNGFRPCGHCMNKKYKVWKQTQS